MRNLACVFGLAVALAAAPAVATQFEFSNNGLIDIPAGQPGTIQGIADPFPSSIAVSGITNVTDVNVTLFSLTHAFATDIEIFLRGPDGSVIVLFSDKGGPRVITGINLTFDDEAGSSVTTPIVTGTFRPDTGIFDSDGNRIGINANVADFGLSSVSELQNTLSVFDGIDPTGNWDLFIFDDFGGVDANSGALEEGWRITFQASAVNAVPAPSMLGIFALALTGLGWARRRRYAY